MMIVKIVHKKLFKVPLRGSNCISIVFYTKYEWIDFLKLK